MTKCYRSGVFFPIVFVLLAQFIAGADDHIPVIAWRIPIGQPPADPGGRKPELTGMIDDGFWQGAPGGGLGAGTFSRSYRGNFERWHIKAGVHKYQSVPANQFAVFAQAEGEPAVAQVLSTGKPEGSALSAWSWSYRAGNGEYAALYPKSWFAYRSNELPITLTLEQFSPVLPDNYKMLAGWDLPLVAQTDAPNPASIESAWQKANSKYDGARAAILKDVDRQVQAGPFRADWESLQKYQAPEWYEDAKFGIFIHWGLYSVPAFANEWYSRNMYQPDSPEFKHHVATYGPQSKFGYKDFIPMFKAEHFNAGAWARLFREAGAKYVVPVAEHHDGFPIYNSNLTDWCAGKMGPKRDLVGELAAAVRAEGLHFGASSHRAEHDWFFDGGRKFDSDVNAPKFAAFYGPAHLRILKPGYDDKLFEDWTYVSREFMDDWLARTAEIVEKYHPDLIYFDWWIGQPSFRDHVSRFAAFYYNQGVKLGTGAVINYKNDAFEEHSATLDVERGQLSDIRPLHWQTDTSISNASWGYIEGDTFKSPEFIVHLLADVVSKNGNLLLNVGPRPDGTIPEPVQQVLRDVGAWLKVNGEAIYGTRPWTLYGEGPTVIEGGAFHEKDTKPYTSEDFRFTTKGQTLYAVELGWPSGGQAVIHCLGGSALKGRKIQRVDLLGSAAKLKWSQDPDALRVQLPEQPPGRYAYVLRVLGPL